MPGHPLGPRRVVGWAMADHLRGELVADAPASRCGSHDHTDRGSQYTASAYQARLAVHGIVASMSRTGDCYDNALAESFFATLKTERIDRQAWPTQRAARRPSLSGLKGSTIVSDCTRRWVI